MIVYLEGGPYGGQYWDTKVLLGKAKRAADIEFYDFTPAVKTSESTGRTAPIWRFNETRASGLTE